MERINREQLFMEIITVFAKRSTCARLSVGCIIVKDQRIISSGYNGALKSEVINDKCNCDFETPCTKAIHAEANAICFAAKSGISLINSTLYCSYSPCVKCAELIIQSGVTQVNYQNEFRDSAGLMLLARNNIKCWLYLGDGIKV